MTQRVDPPVPAPPARWNGPKAALLLLIAIGLVSLGVVAVIRHGSTEAVPSTSLEPSKLSTSTQAPTMNSPSKIRRDGDRVWIDGVPILDWGKTGETTYCGALSAALSVTDRPFDYATLMGDSGLAFRLRWWRSDAGDGWDMSSPVGEFPEWVSANVRAIGWDMFWEAHFDDGTDFAKFAPDIVASIDAGRPVLAYPTKMDMGVIYGYEAEGKRLLVRDYWVGETQTLIEPSAIKGVLGFLKDRHDPLPRRDAIIEGLRAAVRDWDREAEADDMQRDSKRGSYHFGSKAYELWKADLRGAGALSPDGQKSLSNAGWWAMNVMNDARLSAVKYLRASAPLFDGDARAALERAADHYQAFVKTTGVIFWEKNAFFGPWSEKGLSGPNGLADWTPEVREREIALLDAAQKLDDQAIAEIRSALKILSADPSNRADK